MVEKKKGKKRKEEYVEPGENVVEKPSKEEYNVAKWLRKNVPIKKTKFLNHIVEYFSASRAIDAVLESKFAKGDNALFTNREEVVDYMQMMLEHRFFHRARKIPVLEHELRGKKKDKKKEAESGDERKKIEEKKKVEEKKKIEEKKEKGTDAENSVTEGNSEKSNKGEKEKKKCKIRLDMHNDQIFVDSLDAYVWIYDPIPFYYWIIGTLLVLGAIGLCLFPLWPPSVRLGVYYLSVAGAGFFALIILLVIIRLMIFCLVWLLTAGKHHIWILPNLTEDVGLLASFWPLYKYQYKGNTTTTTTKKKKKKDKDSDAEEEADDAPERVEKIDSPTHRNSSEDERQSDNVVTEGCNQDVGGSETESDSSQRSSTERDFEMVEKVDIES